MLWDFFPFQTLWKPNKRAWHEQVLEKPGHVPICKTLKTDNRHCRDRESEMKDFLPHKLYKTIQKSNVMRWKKGLPSVINKTSEACSNVTVGCISLTLWMWRLQTPASLWADPSPAKTRSLQGQTEEHSQTFSSLSFKSPTSSGCTSQWKPSCLDMKGNAGVLRK